MKKNYKLTGMGCGGCVSNVKRALLELPDVSEADVQLNPQSATLTMNVPLDIKELQSQLSKAGNYSILELG